VRAAGMAARTRGARIVVAAVALAAVPFLLARDVPFLSGRINDTADMIPAEVRERLEGKLAAFEKETGAQVAVLTIDTLGGDVLEDYSLKVAQTWKLGRKGVDDGALLLIVKDDRKLRIEVGYGLEGKLTDAQCGRILDDVVRPEFRNGDFGRGVEAGVDAIIGMIQGKDTIPSRAPARGKRASEVPLGARLIGSVVFTLVIGVFSLLALLSKGCQSWFLYVFLVPFYAAFPLALWGALGAMLIPIWVIGFPIAKYWLRKTPAGKHFLKTHPGLATFAASGGHSGSGHGWGSGGFSGGGGSFGGGGASGGW
jgi:uncharacterized protein